MGVHFIFLRVLLSHTSALCEILSHKWDRDWRCKPSIATRVPYSFPFLEMLFTACHQSHMYIGNDNISNVCWKLAVMSVGVHRIASAKVCLSPPLSLSLGRHFCFLRSPFSHYHNLDQCPHPPVAFQKWSCRINRPIIQLTNSLYGKLYSQEIWGHTLTRSWTRGVSTSLASPPSIHFVSVRLCAPSSPLRTYGHTLCIRWHLQLRSPKWKIPITISGSSSSGRVDTDSKAGPQYQFCSCCYCSHQWNWGTCVLLHGSTCAQLTKPSSF